MERSEAGPSLLPEVSWSFQPTPPPCCISIIPYVLSLCPIVVFVEGAPPFSPHHLWSSMHSMSLLTALEMFYFFISVRATSLHLTLLSTASFIKITPPPTRCVHRCGLWYAFQRFRGCHLVFLFHYSRNADRSVLRCVCCVSRMLEIQSLLMYLIVSQFSTERYGPRSSLFFPVSWSALSVLDDGWPHDDHYMIAVCFPMPTLEVMFTKQDT